MLKSPYTPGAGIRPRALAGRSALLEDARGALSGVRMSGEPASPITVFTGSRGLGKTVLLHAIREQAEQAGFAAAHIALDKSPHALQRIAQQVGRAVAGAAGSKTMWERIGERLAQFSVELSAAGMVKLASSWRADDAPPSVVRDQLAEVVVEAADLARAHSGAGLLLTLDEIQDCPSGQLAGIAHLIQDAGAEEAPLAVFIAGLAHTPETLMAAASFTERFHYVELERLDPGAAHLALVNPAAEAGVTWAPDAARLVLDEAAGSPYLIQLLGHTTWQAAAPIGPSRLEPEHARTGLEQAQRTLNQGLFRGRWLLASPGEREFLAAVAGCLTGDQAAAMNEVAALLGKTTKQLSTVRQRLIDKGMVEGRGHNRIGFTMPGFERFVLQQDPDAGTTQ
ncbi:AAA family ATPase [Tessaracoccus oleiagri]|uniref:AAA family ATPase n=1 Tax=Tessaracoccus oleiagri TaxID=686624 RepID=UPI0015A4099E|nr:AAA family ATPase [Tessaracoccus oleiagri]